MRKLYPFGWIDRDLKELGFLKQMSPSAAKLYILYVLAGGMDGRSCYGIEALKDATGLSGPTIYKTRQELEDVGLITTQKEMIKGYKNKKPKIWVELQDLPVNRIEVKQRRDKARKEIIIKKIKRRKTGFVEQKRPSYDRYHNMSDWLKTALKQLREREGYV